MADDDDREEKVKRELRSRKALAAATVAGSPVRYGEIYIDRDPHEDWLVFAVTDGWN